MFLLPKVYGTVSLQRLNQQLFLNSVKFWKCLTKYLSKNITTVLEYKNPSTIQKKERRLIYCTFHRCIHKYVYLIVFSIVSHLKIRSGLYTAVSDCLCVSSGLIKHKNMIRLNHCPFVRYSDNLSVHTALLLIIISVYQHTVQSKQPLISIIIF